MMLPGTPARAGSSLDFDGSDDHVTMGATSALGLSTFTVECWFRWDGEGDDADTGSGGVEAYPLVSKGRGESDGGTQDMNYFLGVSEGSHVLTADFEDMADGTNHPVAGVTPVDDGMWHHAAVTYDGDTWTLVLDGVEDTALSTGGATPRHDSEQHFGVGTAMNTNGTTSGHFRGAIDEVRVWSEARTAEEIRSSINEVLDTSQTGLVARWGFDEGDGSTAGDSIGEADGTVVGATWAGDAPFDANFPPDPPVLVAPDDGAENVSLSPSLSVEVSDPEGDDLTVRAYGRKARDDTGPFTIVALPDTQYYSCECQDGEAATFTAQTQWIVDQCEARDIAFVTHLGDITDHGDSYEEEWINASNAMYLLEDPATTGLSDGLPYGLAVGNHDQSPNGPDGDTEYFNQYFGIDHFEGRAYYGDHYGEDNDNHYILFSAGGLDFIGLHLEYDTTGGADVLAWASDVLDQYADRRALLSAHYLLSTSGTFSSQGLATYEALKHHPNLFLMQAGHLTGEAWRADTYEGNTVYTLLADYQFDGNGGDGWLRVLELSPPDDEIRVMTYSPTRDEWATDADSDFVLPYPMSRDGFELIVEGDSGSGTTMFAVWPELEPFTEYEWYVEVSDGHTVVGDIWSFTTGDGSAGDDDDDDMPSDDDAGDDDSSTPAGVDGGCSCGADHHPGAPIAGLGLLAALVAILLRSLRARR